MFQSQMQTRVMQEILPFCQSFNVPAAEAFLYERLGNINSALQIYIDQAISAIQDLMAKVQKRVLSEKRLQELLDNRTPHSQLMPRYSRELEDQALSVVVSLLE